jgi:hypothetical protein
MESTMSIWIIEESPIPGIWNILRSRGIYKTKKRVDHAAKELMRRHRENLAPDNIMYDWRYRATEYTPTQRENQ